MDCTDVRSKTQVGCLRHLEEPTAEARESHASKHHPIDTTGVVRPQVNNVDPSRMKATRSGDAEGSEPRPVRIGDLVGRLVVEG